jgi:hypothetical protein
MNHNDFGVIVGTSRRQEWLLPWWWMHFRMHNDLPVLFVDFGDLSSEALSWCRKRGEVVKLELSDDFMGSRDEIDPMLVKDWESMQPNVWSLRFTWYKKPFTLLLSPFQKTLWLDLDCQVQGSLDPLFSIPLQEGGIGIVAESERYQLINWKTGRNKSTKLCYNAGVILYETGSKIVQEWIAQSKQKNREHCSDQQMLVHVLNTSNIPFTSLPAEYNWTLDRGLSPKAVILHCFGDIGKVFIKNQINFLTANWAMNLSFDEKDTVQGDWRIES